MTVGKGAALRILAAEADRSAVLQDCCKSQCLGQRPVDPFPVLQCILAALENPLQLRIHLEAGRSCQQLLVDLLQCAERDRCRARCSGFSFKHHRCFGFAVLMLAFLHGFEGGLQHAFRFGTHALHFFCSDDLLALQPLGIQPVDRRMAADFAVNNRLGCLRVIHFIMAVTAVADQIDDEILFEQIAVGTGQTDG
ncbi:hypothetical protein D3C80_1200230 [compost metagenome]